MNKLSPILTCLILTTLFSLPSILRIPSVIPFLDADVRAKAPKAIEEIRKEGIWMVNTHLKSVTKDDNGTCFHFDHQYSQQETNNQKLKTKNSLSTCIQ